MCIFVDTDVGVLDDGLLECTRVVVWFVDRVCVGVVSCLVWVV